MVRPGIKRHIPRDLECESDSSAREFPHRDDEGEKDKIVFPGFLLESEGRKAPNKLLAVHASGKGRGTNQGGEKCHAVVQVNLRTRIVLVGILAAAGQEADQVMGFGVDPGLHHDLFGGEQVPVTFLILAVHRVVDLLGMAVQLVAMANAAFVQPVLSVAGLLFVFDHEVEVFVVVGRDHAEELIDGRVFTDRDGVRLLSVPDMNFDFNGFHALSC